VATTIYTNLRHGTITNSPLGSGGTSITSAEFAALPAVPAPGYPGTTLWLTLDPTDEGGGATEPEIVKVTAHTASSTTVTVERAQQGTTARTHVAGTVWASNLTQQDVLDLQNWAPAGTIRMTVWGTADPGWLLFGTTGTVDYTNADTLYPYLWERVPTSWKVGSTLRLPAMGDRFPVGVATPANVGVSASSNVRNLTVAQLPAHAHVVPQFTDVNQTVSVSIPAHSHGMDHGHTGSAPGSGSSGGHGHSINARADDVGDHSHGVGDPGHVHSQQVTANAGSGGPGVRLDYDGDGSGSSGYPQGVTTYGSGTGIWVGGAGTHGHFVSFSSVTGGDHSHAVNIPTSSGYGTANHPSNGTPVTVTPQFTVRQHNTNTATPSGPAMTAANLDVTPANLPVYFQIKAH
jgi:hypothetical protein